MKDLFLSLSSDITGFTGFELLGTGQAEAYRAKVKEVVGPEVMDELLQAYARMQGDPNEQRRERLRKEIFGDEKLGPIARSLIKMWYVGTWYPLPPEWTEAFGAREQNVLAVVSPASYTEGLLWPAIGANPPGAKAPGYGSWAAAPQIPAIPPTAL